MDSKALIHDFINNIEVTTFIRNMWIKNFKIGSHILSHTRNTTAIFFVENGLGIFKINNNSVEAKINDCIIYSSEEDQLFSISIKQSCTILYIQFDFQSFTSEVKGQGIYTFVKPYHMSLINELYSEKKGFLILKKHFELQHIIKKIILEINSKFQEYESFVKLLSCELLISIARTVETECSKNINTANRYVNTAISIIESGISQDLTPEYIAKSVHISIDYLHHLFKKNTGYSLMEYVSEKRIEVSKMLLDSSKFKVSEISVQVGLEPQYFSTLFKKHTSLSPNEYRNRFEFAHTISDVKYFIKVNCGGDTCDSLFKDQLYCKKNWGYVGNTFTYSTINPQAPDFSFPDEMNSLRFGGVFKYIFNVPDGHYTVNLYFSEIYWTSAHNRLFTVKINNRIAVENFDIFSEAGGQNKGVEKIFKDIYVYDGILEIEFVSIEDYAQINIIIVEKMTVL